MFLLLLKLKWWAHLWYPRHSCFVQILLNLWIIRIKGRLVGQRRGPFGCCGVPWPWPRPEIKCSDGKNLRWEEPGVLPPLCWRAFRRGLACPCNKTNSSCSLVVYSLLAPSFTILSSIWLSFWLYCCRTLPLYRIVNPFSQLKLVVTQVHCDLLEMTHLNETFEAST